MKYVIVIGDGMADNPLPDRGGQTPLEICDISCMDSLCRRGEGGTVRTVPIGVPPGSDTAILSIFGYDPRRYYAGRAPLEAAGAGIPVEPGQVAFRCNMVSLEEGDIPFDQRRIVSHSGGNVEGEQALALLGTLEKDNDFAALARQYGMSFFGTPSFRHIAILKEGGIDGLKTAPPHDHLSERIGIYLPRDCDAAVGMTAMMERAYQVLNYHPINQQRRKEGALAANGIWFWAEGRALALPSLAGRYGKTGFVVSAVPLVHGIGRLAGLDSVEVPGATGELDTDYEGKATAVVNGLQSDYDFAVLHVEAPDECTHNGDTEGKLEAIRRLDSRCIAPLVQGLDKAGLDVRILILSDHKTLTATRGHDATPVPYILYDSRKDSGWNLPYSERDCAAGPMLEEGCALIGRLFSG